MLSYLTFAFGTPLVSDFCAFSKICKKARLARGGCEMRAPVANHGNGPLRHGLLTLTRCLRGAYANLRHQTCKK